MKKIGVILFFSMLALVSCNKINSSNDGVPFSNNVVSSPISTSSLPATITSYISDNYPDATIYSAVQLSNSQAKYIVLLSTEEELAFDGRGNFLGDGEDFCHGGGPFPGGDSLHHGHPWHGCPPNWINIDSLAGAIKSFVTTNYPNYQIWHAERDSVCPDGSVIEVMIRKPGTRPPVDLTLFFSTADNYIMVAERIRYSDVPQAVKNYISANFNVFHQCLMSQQLTLADSSLNYSIFVNQPRMHKRVVLTSGGTLVCEQ
ncbi:MAG: PepSY-like domain-containing protein [Bacteroidales bacterium]